MSRHCPRRGWLALKLENTSFWSTSANTRAVPLGFERGFGIDGDGGGFGDLGDEGAKAAIGIHPVDAAGVGVAEAVDVFDGELGFAEAARADDHARALDDGGAIAEEGVVELPEGIHAADELAVERAVGHAMALGEGADGRKLSPQAMDSAS
jgi:hypothetical protein